MGPFEVTKELVGGLGDEALRRLLDRLLTAEANVRGISHLAISVGGSQTAGDGGVDGSIDWDDCPDPLEWLPRRLTYFQCKAEAMGAAKLRDEMRPAGSARPVFVELAGSGGAYVVFSTDDPSKSGMDARLSRMRECVDDVPGAEAIHLDFYGADRIARWANGHAGVAMWLLGQAGRALGGWRPHGDWSAPGSSGGKYLMDEDARAVIGEESVEVGDAISGIRAALRAPGGVVRLVGLSGMGKTRLAEALFDTRIGEDALPEARAIYGDSGQDLDVGAARVAEELQLSGSEAVLIVDNANAAIHSQLAEIAGRSGSRISVLTIDYDVGDEKPPGVLVTLEANSEAVLESILEQRHPKLSSAERHHLAKFSGGNARIALKVAEGAGEGVDLSKLNDGQLLDRLFQKGRQDQDPQARGCADAASLVTAFYAEDGDQQVAELPTLAAIAGVTEAALFRNVAVFLEWGIVQQRGPQRAVMPPPFANMLAAPFVRRSDPQVLLDHFLSASPRLLISFARRLGQLHDEPAAVRLAKRLYAADGAFGEPATLDGVLRQGFVRLAPCAPRAALAALERSLAGENGSRLLDPAHKTRRDYVELLVQLAHEESEFACAMEILLQFALADGEDEGDGRASKHLLERFWSNLSFTLASQGTRLDFIDRMLDDQDPRVSRLGLEALDHMMNAGHFSSSLNVEFGSKALLQEWRPNNGAGYPAWFEAASERVLRVARSGGADVARTRDIVADHLRDHLDAGLGERPIEAVRDVRGNDYWDGGWRAVTDALQFSGEGLPAAVLSNARQLERDLRPRTIEDCFEAFVLGEPWRHHHPVRSDKRPTRDVGKLAEAVGLRVGRRSDDPMPYLLRAMAAEGESSVWEFARGLARSSGDLDRLWGAARTAFEETDSGKRNALVLAGLIEGAARQDRAVVERWLDKAMDDPTLAEHIVVLQVAMPLDARAMARFGEAIGRKAVPLRRFSHLQGGCVSKPVPGSALSAFLQKLYQEQDGALPALQILHMRLFGDRTDKRDVDPSLTQLGRQFLADGRTFAEENGREDHGIATIATVALDGDGAEEAAIATCRALRGEAENDRYFHRDFDKVCKLLAKRFPRIVLDEIVGHGSRRGLVGRFFGGSARDNDNDNVDGVSLDFDDDVLIEWMQEAPADRAPMLAGMVPYYRKRAETGVLEWTDLAMSLIGAPDDPTPVLEALEHRFYSGGGSGPWSSRLVRRRPLMAALKTHADVRVRNWARAAGKVLEASIASRDKIDRDRESRFE